MTSKKNYTGGTRSPQGRYNRPTNSALKFRINPYLHERIKKLRSWGVQLNFSPTLRQTAVSTYNRCVTQNRDIIISRFLDEILKDSPAEKDDLKLISAGLLEHFGLRVGVNELEKRCRIRFLVTKISKQSGNDSDKTVDSILDANIEEVE